jgi:tryptophanyl-tRNA synthetase
MAALTLLATASKLPFVASFTMQRPTSAAAAVTSLSKLYMSTETESAPAEKKELKVRTRRILSGVQPTGSLHLGNYLGAIRQWVDFQNQECVPQIDEEKGIKTITENYFCVVDLHAITMPHDPKELGESTLSSAALYIAAGIDPNISKVFIQSHVPAHSELCWLLNCATPMNWLERMIQFKDKAKKAGSEAVGVGLFTYPVLMAADILLYQADRVPVGEDQRQHLELARDIVRRFTDMYNKGGAFKKRCKKAGIPSFPTFTEPEAMIVKEGGARVMSLSDGRNKMSKSDTNDYSRINVLDPPKLIRDKIKKCKTDAVKGLEWGNPDRPEATNLLSIYAAVQPEPKTKEEILAEVGDMSWGDFKPVLADAIVAHLEPIQKRYHEVRDDEEYLNSVLKNGADSADEIASKTVASARIAMGFTPRT